MRLLAYGGLAVIPIIFVGSILNLLIAEEPLFTQTLVHAINEEIFKFLVIKHFVYDKKLFAAPIDGIIYAVMASLGFALVEYIQFVFSNQLLVFRGYNVMDGYSVALIRMFTAVPMHALAGVMMGYFLGRAKFSEAEEKQLIFKALGSAALFHTVYNYTPYITGSYLFLFIVLGFGFYCSKYLIRDGRLVDKMLEVLSTSEVDSVVPEKPSNQNSKHPEIVIKSKFDEVDVAPEFYEKAYNELESGEAKSDIWAMAYAKSSNEEDAKKKYITLRAAEIADEANKKDDENDKDKDGKD